MTEDFEKYCDLPAHRRELMHHMCNSLINESVRDRERWYASSITSEVTLIVQKPLELRQVIHFILNAQKYFEDKERRNEDGG